MGPLTSAEFIIQFHSLTGTTIGERRKSLFLLLHQASDNNLIIDFKALQPRTALEDGFKLQALIYFNKVEELLVLLTSENPILVHQIIKKASPSIIRALCNATDEQLLNILSKISLNAKLKLLNKCGQYLENSQKAEVFLDAVKNKYGIYLATKLLTACSPQFIKVFLENNRFTFTARQFVIVSRKHPDFIQLFLTILHKHVNVVQEYRHVFKYLSRHNVPVFLSLRKVYDLSALQFGWRATNKLIKRNKSSIINDAKLYSEILNSKYILRSLRGEEFRPFYYSLFPPLITQFDKSYQQILTLTPSLDLLLSGFSRTYNTELWNEPKLVMPKILEMATNKQRLKLLKPEYKPADFTNDDWDCYLPTVQAIPLLKKRILLTSDIKSRARLVHLLVETCRINKDNTALLEICNYMIKQHRNDHVTVRLAFLKALKKGFKLENLEIPHWALINELIQIFELNGEDFYHIEDFLTSYIECCLKNKQPIKDALLLLVKRLGSWHAWKILSNKPAYEKICIQTIPEVFPDLKDDVDKFRVAYVNTILSWNKRHPKDTLPLFDDPKYLDSLMRFIKEADSYYLPNRDETMRYILPMKIIPERNSLLQLYILQPRMDLYKMNWFNWFIHSDIHFLLSNQEACVNIALKTPTRTVRLWMYCKLYSHLDLPQKIIDICLNTLSQELPPLDRKTNALTALSCLMPPSEYFTLKHNTGPYMKNITPSSYLVETVLNRITNSLPSVKRTVFSLMNNTTESTLHHFMLQLMQVKNKNVRKVALYILFRTMNKQTVMNVLKDFLHDTNNVALNKFILATVFKYFVKNPNEYVWNIIQLSVNTLDVDDQEAYNLVLQPTKVPDEYLARYVVFIWNAVETLPGFYKDYGIKLLQVARPDTLPQEFCENLIAKYFFKYGKNHTTFYVVLHAFVCKYLCSNQAKLLEYLHKAVTTSHNANFKMYGLLNHFVKQMCYECIRQNKKDLLIKFAAGWDGLVKPHEKFEEYLNIQLSLIKIEQLPVLEVGARVASLCISVTDKYGNECLYPFSQELKSLLVDFLKSSNDEITEMNWFTLVENIINRNVFVLILLGILLLKCHEPNLIETKKKYDDIIVIVEARPEPEVRMYLNDLLDK